MTLELTHLREPPVLVKKWRQDILCTIARDDLLALAGHLEAVLHDSPFNALREGSGRAVLRDPSVQAMRKEVRNLSNRRGDHGKS